MKYSSTTLPVRSQQHERQVARRREPDIARYVMGYMIEKKTSFELIARDTIFQSDSAIARIECKKRLQRECATQWTEGKVPDISKVG